MIGNCCPLEEGGEALSGGGHCAERPIFAQRVERYRLSSLHIGPFLIPLHRLAKVNSNSFGYQREVEPHLSIVNIPLWSSQEDRNIALEAQPQTCAEHSLGVWWYLGSFKF